MYDESVIPEEFNFNNQTNAVWSEDGLNRLYEAAKAAKKSAKKAKKAVKKAKKALKEAKKAAKESNADNYRNKERNGTESLFSKVKKAVINAMPQIVVSAIKKAINGLWEFFAKRRGIKA